MSFICVENVIAFASITAAACAILAFIHAKAALKYQKWHTSFSAFRENMSNSDYKNLKMAYQTDIKQLGIPVEITEALAKRIFTIWIKTRTLGYTKYVKKNWSIEKTRDYVYKNKLKKWFIENTDTGDLIRTTLFIALWPYLRQFWDRSEGAVVVPIVDAIVLETVRKGSYCRKEPYCEYVNESTVNDNKENYEDGFAVWYPISN